MRDVLAISSGRTRLGETPWSSIHGGHGTMIWTGEERLRLYDSVHQKLIQMQTSIVSLLTSYMWDTADSAYLRFCGNVNGSRECDGNSRIETIHESASRPGQSSLDISGSAFGRV